MSEPEFLRATRASYDIMAVEYADWIRDELTVKPLDRGMLAGFADLVRATDAGPIADIGCGPGRVTAHLHGLGLSVFGIDLSPQMVAVARQAHPNLRFDVGSMLALDLADGSLGGIVAWYSIIHVPQERLLDAFAEFHRVLAPGGHLLLAFQAGDEVSHRTEALDHVISLDFHRRQPARVAELLDQAGLVMRAQLLREPDDDGDFPEKTQQAFLLARKPADASTVTTAHGHDHEDEAERSTGTKVPTEIARPAPFEGNILDTSQQTAYARQLETFIGGRARVTEQLAGQSETTAQIKANLNDAFYAGREARMHHEALEDFADRLGREGIENPEVDSALSRATESYEDARSHVNSLDFLWRVNGGGGRPWEEDPRWVPRDEL